MKRPEVKLTFRLTLHSDYHVGSGHCSGPLVDSALLRDHDFAPILRGTALAGLIRDGLRDLRETPAADSFRTMMDDAENRMFGTPEQRKRWAFSSARPVGGVAGKTRRWGAQDSTRVRINPRTRRSDAQKLFSEEEGDARLAFEFTATCPSASAQDVRDAFLLIAAARMVRNLGAARRRGRGECVIALDAAEGMGLLADGAELTNRALDKFKEQWLDGKTIQVEKQDTPKDPSVALSLIGLRKRFRVIARLGEPLIVARRSEAANAYETMPIIPGTTLLGAIADRATAELDLKPENEPPSDFVTLFFRSGVRVSGLLPAERKEATLYPSIPAPSLLFVCENFPAYDDAIAQPHPIKSMLLTTEGPGKCAHPGCQAKLQSLDGYFTLKPLPSKLTPLRREEAHIQMERKTGRAKTGVLFEYIALEAGQWFVGELDCANEECWERLKELTGLVEQTAQSLRLGKASRRGYGLITLVLQPMNPEEPSPWVLQSLNERVTQTTEPLSLTLLTDAIVPDAWGRFHAGFDVAWIAGALGLEAQHIELLGNSASTRDVDTFNAYRRLARWRDQAITGGSAAGFRITPSGLEALGKQWRKEFKVDPPTSLQVLQWKLSQVERDGIGLRCNEGFGRVAFNHPILNQPPHDIWSGIALLLPPDFLPQVGLHDLEAETAFRREWTDMLKEEKWDTLTEDFEPVARMLFISRNVSLDQVRVNLDQLGKPSPEYLWKKSIPAREKKPKINPDGLAVIARFIALLEKRPSLSDRQRAIALELLAERVAIQAAKKRQEAGNEN